MRNSLWFGLSAALFFTACTPTTPPTNPGRETAEDPARALARKVHEAAGGARLSEVAELRFTFVYYQGDQRVFAAQHRFDRKNWRARVSWTNRQGNKVEALVDLRTKTGQGSIDGVPVTGDAQAELAQKAYARWVNDAYWLLMPLKLLDPGVTLAKEEPRTWEGKSYEILRLSFQGVGLTPGDTYWLYVDPASYRVVRWEMKLEGQTEPPDAVTWTDYRAVGPLWLAFDHLEAGGRVAFEEVEALSAVVESDFTLVP